MFFVAGDLNIDVTTAVPAVPHAGKEAPADITLSFGGQGANVAYFLSCLGNPVRLFGCVGDDEAGHLYRRHLETLGIVFDGLPSRLSTGMVSVVQEADSYRMYRQRGANAVADPARFEAFVKAAIAASADTPACLFVSGYTLAGAGYADVLARVLGHCTAQHLVTTLDPASIEAMRELGRDTVLRTARLFDWFLPNEEEAAWLAEHADPVASAAALSSLTGRSTVVKRGARGAVLCHRGATVSVDSVHATETDVTGAGDAFAAGFLSSLAAGRDAAAACSAGVHFSGAKVALRGTQPDGLRTFVL